MISYEKHGGIWYQIPQQKGQVEDTCKQILMPKSLREKVMQVAHDSLLGGQFRSEENGEMDSN